MKFHTRKSMGAHLPALGIQQGASKDKYVSNILLHWNGKVNAL